MWMIVTEKMSSLFGKETMFYKDTECIINKHILSVSLAFVRMNGVSR